MNVLQQNPPNNVVSEDFKPSRKLNKRQRKFIDNWLDPNSETFGNAYQSAIEAGFSDYSSRVITSNSHNLLWVQEAKKYLEQFTPTHIIAGMQQIAQNGKQESNRLRSLELLAKLQGLFIERSMSQIDVKFTNDVPRPVINVDASID